MRLIYPVLLTSFFSFSAGAKSSSRDARLGEALTCPSTTVNYITQTLPQQCLRTNWSRSRNNGTQDAGFTTPAADDQLEREVAQDTKLAENAVTVTAYSEFIATSTQQAVESCSPPDSEVTDEDGDPLANHANFLSFEEWKMQMLEKAGQSPDHIVGVSTGASDQGRNRQRQQGINNALDSLGDDGEIELDFTGFVNQETAPESPAQPPLNDEKRMASFEADTSAAPVRRSKEAGTTSKERFNYASFDCAATVLKTNQGSKGATWILSENKDSYLINKCAGPSKYFIVELCNDILIDTVVLGNFEFFSSTFRTFRVSISDRYPVKAEKWREIGTFEARNTRGVQAFMVEDGLFWARYLKVELLTHYGSEYYCPVSLLRVHGTTMVDDWRNEMKENNEQDDDDGDEASLITSGEVEPPEVIPIPPIKTSTLQIVDVIVEEKTPSLTSTSSTASISQSQPQEDTGQSKESDSTASTSVIDAPQTSESAGASEQPSKESAEVGLRTESDIFMITPVQAVQSVYSEPPMTEPAKSPTTSLSSNVSSETLTSSMNATEPLSVTPMAVANITSSTVTSSSDPEPSTTQLEGTIDDIADIDVTLLTSNTSHSSSSTVNATPMASDQGTYTSDAKAPGNTTSATKTKIKQSSPIKASLATPSSQDSFFRSVHKRLTMLEVNATLSLQYIEEQSRILRDAFQKAEKKQLQKASSFLETLNLTVFTELRTLQLQYDQHWQSTVLELAAQRQEHQKDMLIVYEKLGMLANELIWQKRWAYIHLILTVLLYGYLLFTKNGVPIGAHAPLDLTLLESIQHLRRGGSMSFSKRYPSSPDSVPGTPTRPNSFSGLFTRWPKHRREHSDGLTSGDELATNPTSSPDQHRNNRLHARTSSEATTMATRSKSPSVSFGPLTPATDREDILDGNVDMTGKATDTETDTEREVEIPDIDPAALKRAASSPPLGRQFEPPADDDIGSSSDETTRAMDETSNVPASNHFGSLYGETNRAVNGIADVAVPPPRSNSQGTARETDGRKITALMQ